MRIGLGPDQVRHQLREDWTRLLGVVEPLGAPRVVDRREQRLGTVTLHRITLGVDGEPRTIVPVVLLEPEPRVGSRLPVIVALAQGGKQSFLEQRSKEIATWLAGGAAVCLVDVRGTGETRPRDGSRRHSGSITSISATEWLLGQTLLGSRLRDLRSVLRHLRDRSEIDAGRIALWGDSFAPTNPPDFDPAVPLDADPYPQLAEPLGGLLALFGALFEDNIRAVAVRGGLIGYAALLESPYCYVPHDALVPAALTAGDLGDVASALAPRPLRIGPLVDGLNRAVPADTLTTRLEPVRQAYRARGAESHLQLAPDDGSAASAASWLLTQCLAD